MAKSAEKKIDAHVHVWANAEQKEEFPFVSSSPLLSPLLSCTLSRVLASLSLSYDQCILFVNSSCPLQPGGEPPFPGNAELLLESMKVTPHTLFLPSRFSSCKDLLAVWLNEQGMTIPSFPLQEAGVHGAVMVQPANHKFDHSYVSGVMSRYPGRFVGCLLADPTDGGGGVPELDRLITQEGYR